MNLILTLVAGALFAVAAAPAHARQDGASGASIKPVVFTQADGSTIILSRTAIDVDGDRCVPVADLAVALHGTAVLAPDLVLTGSTLTANTTTHSSDKITSVARLRVQRPGLISNHVRTFPAAGKRPVHCVPARDLARAMGGVFKHNASIEGFDAQIDSMSDNNLAFLALQTKVQNVSQTTQLMSNIAKADSDAKLNSTRNIHAEGDLQAALFEETENVLALAPARQVDWARAYASGDGRNANAAQIRAAVNAAFADDPPAMRAQTSLIAQLIRMGDILGAIHSYALLQERDQRAFSRAVVAELDKVRKARAQVIRNFARTKPPRAYAGSNPQTAARAQDRSQRHTQFVQMSTQRMNELQNTERELVDALQTMQRDLDSFWENYASFRDEKFRTTDRVMQTR